VALNPIRFSKPRLSRRVAVLVAAAALGIAVLGIAQAYFTGRDMRTAQFVEYRMPERSQLPTAIAARDGVVWFTIDVSDRIGRIRGGQLEQLPIEGPNIEPIGLAIAPDGSAWFTDIAARGVARISPSGNVSRFKLDTPIVRLGRIAIAPDGSVWFAEPTRYSITQLNDGSFIRHEVTSPRGGPYGVTIGPDGIVWATLQAGNQILRIDADGQIEAFDVPRPASVPTDIAVGADGSVWFIQFRANRIGRLRDGKFSDFDVGGQSAGLSGLAVATDGTVWFGMLRNGSLGRLRDGRIEIFKLPREGAHPYTVATDPAGNVWYADISGYVGMLPARYAGE
jgi:virginiamycin B lyase